MAAATLPLEAYFEEITFQTEDATITEVKVFFPGSEYTPPFVGKGAAKTNEEDEFDQLTGHKLALARALEDLAGEIKSSYFSKKKR